MRRLGSGLVAMLVAALAAGCGGSNPKPSPVSEAPSASASLSESASPSGAPTMPAEAQGTTAESAEAFVRYYLAVFSYATRTGNVGQLRALGTASCRSCQQLIQRIDAVYSVGGSAAGRGYEAVALTIKTTRRDQAVLSGRVHQFEQTVVPSPGASPSTSPSGFYGSRFELRASGGRWQMQDWSLL